MTSMSPSVVLRSPVRDEPLHGRDAVTRPFAILLPAFDDLRFIESYTSVSGGELLHFAWRIGNHEAEGVDIMHFDGDGLIEDYRWVSRHPEQVRAFCPLAAERPGPGLGASPLSCPARPVGRRCSPATA